jgi:hypothetical protein
MARGFGRTLGARFSACAVSDLNWSLDEHDRSTRSILRVIGPRSVWAALEQSRSKTTWEPLLSCRNLRPRVPIDTRRIRRNCGRHRYRRRRRRDVGLRHACGAGRRLDAPRPSGQGDPYDGARSHHSSPAASGSVRAKNFPSADADRSSHDIICRIGMPSRSRRRRCCCRGMSSAPMAPGKGQAPAGEQGRTTTCRSRLRSNRPTTLESVPLAIHSSTNSVTVSAGSRQVLRAFASSSVTSTGRGASSRSSSW